MASTKSLNGGSESRNEVSMRELNTVYQPDRVVRDAPLTLPEEEKNNEKSEGNDIEAAPSHQSRDSIAVTKAAPGTDWDGPDDVGNPCNWGVWTRRWHMVPPSLISFAATFGSSIYTPAYPQVMAAYGIGQTAALLPLSLYVLALGFGPVLAAPLSETYGRKIVYLTTAPLGMLFTLGAGFSPTFTGLLICRFLAGLFFSPSLAIGAGTNADCNPPHERAVVTAIYILSPFLGPALGPVIGAFVASRKPYAWIEWTIIFFALFAWLLALFTSETYKPIILARRRKQLNIASSLPKIPLSSRLKFVITITLTRPIHMLFTEPIVAFFSIYIAFNFGVMFSFFAAFPYVFRTVYGFDTEQSGLVFLALGVGSVLAVATCVVCDRVYYMKQYRWATQSDTEGVVTPEHRLYAAMMGSCGLPIGLFWFAFTARSDISPASCIIAVIPFAWGNLSIFISAAMYLVDTYQSLSAASAIAANGLLRYIVGAAFPLFAIQMYQRLGVDGASGLLAGLTVLMLPIPWVLFRYGHRIRGRSGYSVVKA